MSDQTTSQDNNKQFKQDNNTKQTTRIRHNVPAINKLTPTVIPVKVKSTVVIGMKGVPCYETYCAR